MNISINSLKHTIMPISDGATGMYFGMFADRYGNGIKISSCAKSFGPGRANEWATVPAISPGCRKYHGYFVF
jgi:hypothetical protein